MRFFEYMEKNEDAGAVFDQAMSAYSSQTAAQVASACPFHEAAVVVDVGGGCGTLISTILDHPRSCAASSMIYPRPLKPPSIRSNLAAWLR